MGVVGACHCGAAGGCSVAESDLLSLVIVRGIVLLPCGSQFLYYFVSFYLHKLLSEFFFYYSKVVPFLKLFFSHFIVCRMVSITD